MSYCRWSCDDYQCDVYCYAHVDGFFAIHVARSRVTPSAETRPADIGAWWTRGTEGIAEFVTREMAVEAWLATGERRPIGLPHDGASFEEPDAASCADRLEYLRGVGYNVPQYAIDSLREEAAAGGHERT